MKKIVRHATERERGLASQTGGCRKRFHSFFFLEKEKCGMTQIVFGMCCSPTAAGRTRAESELQSAAWGGGELRGSEEPQYSHASAYPAAEAISEGGRPQRRSVKNRKSFDCFKSAAGIRFSKGARPTPKSFHRGGFWRYLLSEQKVTYEK